MSVADGPPGRPARLAEAGPAEAGVPDAALAEAGPPGTAPTAARRGAAAGPGRRRAEWLAFAITVVALFAGYRLLSGTASVNSDGASNALQAWDMLHGNVLLHRWWLTDVSFYTTELPEYLLIEVVAGLTAGVVHIAGALTYTLLVALGMLLARGGATGRRAIVRMTVAGGIMLAPQPGIAISLLVLGPDHAGTSVPVLLTWLVLDRAGRKPWVPVVTCLLLAWVMIADALVLFIGIIPLLIVSVTCACREAVVRRRGIAAAWFELSLAGAAVLAVPLALGTADLLYQTGGYIVVPVAGGVAGLAQLAGHIWLAAYGVLTVYGASLSGVPLGMLTLIALLHLAGLALAAWALCLAVRRFWREPDLIPGLLAAGTVVVLAAYVLSTRANNPYTTRDITAVLPFGAVLAGRLLGDRIAAARWRPLLAAVLLGYALSLAYGASQPAVPPANQQLTDWLASHHLGYGLAGYWQAGAATLSSGGQVSIRAICIRGKQASPYWWETNASWYYPWLHRASFLVVNPTLPSTCFKAGPAQAVAAFGQPALTSRLGPYTIMVWHKNLLSDVHGQQYAWPASGRRAGPSAAAKRHEG